MSTVLLTGANGFTGRYVTAALQGDGHSVISLGLSAEKADNSTYFRADLSSAQDTLAVIDRVRPDAVIHLAAIAYVPHADLRAMYLTNVLGARNLLDALARTGSGGQGVILASSANIYGNVPDGLPIKESTAPAPVSDYAISKLAMEYTAKMWADKLPICIVRPFNYTGAGQSEQFLIPKIVAHFTRKAQVIELGNINISRDFSDVRFVAGVYAALLRKKNWGETFNICSGKATSLAEIIAMCTKISGHRVEIRQVEKFMRRNDIKTLVGDPGKLNAWGMSGDNTSTNTDAPPRRYALRDTLTWMLSA